MEIAISRGVRAIKVYTLSLMTFTSLTIFGSPLAAKEIRKESLPGSVSIDTITGVFDVLCTSETMLQRAHASPEVIRKESEAARQTIKWGIEKVAGLVQVNQKAIYLRLTF